jgi:hypothetical protein
MDAPGMSKAGKRFAERQNNSSARAKGKRNAQSQASIVTSTDTREGFREKPVGLQYGIDESSIDTFRN